MTSAAHGHRFDIQAVRAVAVAMVVVFHYSPKSLSGGYIGVDLFFVISGYLITDHLLREVVRTGRIRLAEFWARRIRRLLPAALLVLLVSALAVTVLLPETMRLQNLTEIAYAAMYVVNWALAANSVDYLASDNALSIAQHYWSLSVEEQFYLVWPLLIVFAVWLAVRSKRISREHAIALVLVVIFGTSLVFSIIATAMSQPQAYFVTTTRAWEFAAGGLIAVMPPLKIGSRLHSVVSWSLLAAIVTCAVVFDAATPFPGWIALIPVVSVAGLLWIGDSTVKWSPQYFGRVRAIQVLGDVSYAAYLWHWPLFIVTTVILGRVPGWKWSTVLMVVLIAVSILTKKYVEDPIRRPPPQLAPPRRSFVMMSVGMIAVLTVCILPMQSIRASIEAARIAVELQAVDRSSCFGAYAIVNHCDRPFEMAVLTNPAAVREDQTWRWRLDERDCVSADVSNGNEFRCSYPGNGPKVLLFGDSHAAHFAPPLKTVAQENDWALEVRTRTGCTGFESPDNADDETSRRCIEWGATVREELINDPEVDAIIVGGFSKYGAREELHARAVEGLQQLRDLGKRIIVVRGVPGMGTRTYPTSAPECVERSRPTETAPCAWKRNEDLDWLTKAAVLTGTSIIDPSPLFCSDDSTCHVVVGGVIAYFDRNHMTLTFAKTVSPWLERELIPLVEGPNQSTAEPRMQSTVSTRGTLQESVSRHSGRPPERSDHST